MKSLTHTIRVPVVQFMSGFGARVFGAKVSGAAFMRTLTTLTLPYLDL